MSWWSPEQDELLHQQVKAGKTFSEIAYAFSRQYDKVFTRNGVLGRWHRIRESYGMAPRVPGPGKGIKKPYRKPKLEPQPSTAADREPQAPSPRLPTRVAPVRYLAKWTCQYRGASTNEQPCGVPSHGPWCEDHKKLIYKPKETK